MGFAIGAKAAIWLDGLDISQYFNDLTTTLNIAVLDTSTFGTTAWKTAVEGIADGKVDAKGFYDKNNDATLAAVLRNGGSVLTVGPAGLANVGDLSRLVKIHETNLTESGSVGGLVLMTMSVVSDGAVSFGYPLHPQSADTNTTTGANRDDGAASTTGWHANLHVTAVTGGTWTIKLVDASASNFSDVADVTGGAFTAATGATSQRLSSALPTTALRRYTRYVATAAGGSSPTIPFGLSIARN